MNTLNTEKQSYWQQNRTLEAQVKVLREKEKAVQNDESPSRRNKVSPGGD